jgi:thymidylate synthase ThyX
MISAKVIADSYSEYTEQRITTVEVTIHRFVLAELNTHRVFSRNSASSRAIPILKQIARILNEPAIPVEWGSNQSGMQAGTPLQGKAARKAERQWRRAAKSAIKHAKKLNKMGVHKQIVNRLLEPFMWHTVIITSTEWENFFSQRCSPLAQPEIHVAADHIKAALNDSTPRILKVGEWHLPYIQPDEQDLPLATKIQVSVARCARVSYLTQDGIREIVKDIELFERLTTAEPPHWSPLEHVATPLTPYGRQGGVNPTGNFQGWGQLRHNLHLLNQLGE